MFIFLFFFLYFIYQYEMLSQICEKLLQEIDHSTKWSIFFHRLSWFHVKNCITLVSHGCIKLFSFFQHEIETDIGKVISKNDTHEVTFSIQIYSRLWKSWPDLQNVIMCREDHGIIHNDLIFFYLGCFQRLINELLPNNLCDTANPYLISDNSKLADP